MKGLWVYAVVLIVRDKEDTMKFKVLGINSFYSDIKAARDKITVIKEEINKLNPNGTDMDVTFQKVMFFKGKLKGGKYTDRCTICAAEIDANVPLTEPRKSSLEKS
jgi:hypothetical protein